MRRRPRVLPDPKVLDKHAGLIVYNLDGDVVQAIAPPNLPTILPEDPPTSAGVNLDAPDPCPESEAGDTFGRATRRLTALRRQRFTHGVAS